VPPDRYNSGSSAPPGRGGDGASSREVIIEFIPIGGSVKVTAIDVTTGTEVSAIGPASASQAELERIAIRKLDYVMSKRELGAVKKNAAEPDKGAGGIIV